MSIQKADKFDIYEFINEHIVNQLESGVLPWRKPWKVAVVEGQRYTIPHNYATKRPYTGVNAFLLALTPYRTPMFLTFNQVKEKGGAVKAGAVSLPIVFWKPIREKANEGGDRADGREDKLVLRYYRVFNIEDTTLPLEIQDLEQQPEPVVIDSCQGVVDQMPNRPRIMNSDPARCYYAPFLDVVNMVPAQNFKSAADYYSVLFHELIHATGHNSRLNRTEISGMAGRGPASFGSQTYSREELTAELGAAYLCGVTGISAMTIENSTAYINGWLNKLRGDKRFFFEAAQKAQKAANYIQHINPGQDV